MSRHKLNKTSYSELLDPKHSKSALKRIKIIESTLNLIGSKGIESLTFENVAKYAKMSRHALLYYFHSLSDIVDLAIIHTKIFFQTHAADQIEIKNSVTQIFENYIDSSFDTFEIKNYGNFWMYFIYRCSFDKKYKIQNTEYVQIGYNRIQELIQLGVEKREFLISQNEIPSIARQIQILLTGAIISLKTEFDVTTHPECNIREITKKLIFNLLNQGMNQSSNGIQTQNPIKY